MKAKAGDICLCSCGVDRGRARVDRRSDEERPCGRTAALVDGLAAVPRAVAVGRVLVAVAVGVGVFVRVGISVTVAAPALQRSRTTTLAGGCGSGVSG